MYFLIALVPVLSVPTQFLQQTTTSGQIGEGITTLSSEISTFSSNLTQSLQDLDTSIDTSLSISSQVAVNLITGEQSTIEIDLDSVTSNINDLQQILSYSKDYCQVLETCKSCVSCDNCGWCNNKAVCIPGSEDGPNFGECEDWMYDKCDFEDCGSYKSCTGCLATSKCFWCEFGRHCLTEKKSCSPAFFISNLDSCPYSEQGVIFHSKSENPYLTEELESLQGNQAFLIGLINELANDKEDVLESAAQGQNVVVSGVSVFSELEDLAETVNELQDSELNERQEYRHGLGEHEVNVVKTRIGEEADENTEKQIERIQEDYKDVISGVSEMESNVGGELDYIDQELLRVAEALETANYKKKKSN